MQARPETEEITEGRQMFEGTLVHASHLHRLQVRKGTDIPYVSHLLAVAALVLEYGGDYVLASAALLHDAVEDAGLDDVREVYGDRVADVVLACTDTEEGGDPSKKAPWRERKERAHERLRSASPDAVLVAACDRLHNLRCQNADWKHGNHRAVKFNSTMTERAWAAWASLEVLRDKIPQRLEADLADEVALFEAHAKLNDAE